VSSSIVLWGGTVIDLDNPEGVERNVVISAGKIAENVKGKPRRHDVSHCIILPGFIDIHAHVAPAWGGKWGLDMVLRSGVTCVLDVTGPTRAVRQFAKASRTRIRVGSCDAVRMETIGKTHRATRAVIQQFLARGSSGVKILGGHFPLTPGAIRRVVSICSELGCLCVIHVGSTRTYSDVEGLAEALTLADGAPVHIAHINGYCRGYHQTPLEEASACLALLRRAENCTADSYIFRWNAVPMQWKDGRFASHATEFWLKRLGYSADLDGARHAWQDGKVRMVIPHRGENVLMRWKSDARSEPLLKRALYLSIPVNSIEASIALATAREANGDCTVDCLVTDGGGIPRNVMVPATWDLVKWGAWSWQDAILKTSTRPSQILGLPIRGWISAGTPADLTLIDKRSGEVRGVVVDGRLGLWNQRLRRCGATETGGLLFRARPRPAREGRVDG
jgi:hypothetical protein